jgi:hypothetical protein
MKSFEFMHGGDWYKYENGYIMKKNSTNLYDCYFCPVLANLNDILDGLAIDQLQNIMRAILHGYFTGFAKGRDDKVKEIQHVLKLC